MDKEFQTLFRDPPAPYRGAPFWAWNCKLDRETMVRQVLYFKEMGMGGFHMHCRTGLDTEYLGEEFMEIIRACVEKAKEEDMLAWLYDEDRWPSGFGGGYVTRDPAGAGAGLWGLDGPGATLLRWERHLSLHSGHSPRDLSAGGHQVPGAPGAGALGRPPGGQPCVLPLYGGAGLSGGGPQVGHHRFRQPH